MQVSKPKWRENCIMREDALVFPPFLVWIHASTPKNITTIPYHFISTLLNVNFDFDVTVANDVAIDVAKCSLPGKVMQCSPYPEVRTLTN